MDPLNPVAGQILIVDDTPGNIKIIASMLKEGGYGISFANSGRKALDIIRLTPPDLVLLDIVMPDMDGFETCQKIKADPETATLPVVFLSNITDTDKVVKGLKLGAVDYLNKPVQKDILLARVNTHLTIRTFQKELETKVSDRTEALSRALQQIDDILVSMPSVVISLDREGTVRHWNPKAEERTGIPHTRAVGRPLDTLFHHSAITPARIRTVLDTGSTFRESRVSDGGVSGVSDGHSSDIRYEDIIIYALTGGDGVVIYMDDVTEQVRLEEMMIQSEKMMALGGLAAGIAHEINNPLAGMTQTAELLNSILSEDLSPGSMDTGNGDWDIGQIHAFMAAKKIPKLLSNIKLSGQKAARIVNNMLSFARESNIRKVKCRIAHLLDETLDLAWSTHHPVKAYNSTSIRFVRKYNEDLPKIPCDPTTLQQVFLNIIQNSIYALNDFKDRAPPEFLPVMSISAAITNRGDEIEITIGDNGPGVDKTLQKKIFDPFFTTKPPGVGTGLGLSISYFIITQTHNGSLRINSLPGKGACFIIRLPVFLPEDV